MSACQNSEVLRFVMLLTPLDDEVNIDRTSLRRAGLQRMRSIRSGQEALRIVRAAQEPGAPFALDFIIYSGDLPDMSMDEFMRAFSALAGGASAPLPPVLAFTPEGDESRLLANGARAVLARPYSMNELGAVLEKMRAQAACAEPPAVQAAQQEQAGAQKATVVSSGFKLTASEMLFSAQAKKAGEQLRSTRSASSAAARPAGKTEQAGAKAEAAVLVKRPEPATHKATPAKVESKQAEGKPEQVNQLLYTRTGLNLLRQGKLAAAQDFLRRALRFDPLDLEAAMGLARLHKQKGHNDRAARWLHRAGMICLKAGQAERAAVIFESLPPKWRGDHHMIEAQNLLYDEEFDAACEAFMEISLRQKRPPIHEILGRACQFTDAPEYFLREMCEALERNGYSSTARKLEKRMLADVELEVRPYGFLSRFPKLQEIVTVARFTMKVWRAGEA